MLETLDRTEPTVETPKPRARGRRVTAADALLIDLRRLAELLSVSTRSAKRMVSDDAIPGVCRPYGRALRFRMADIQKWIQAGCPRARR